MKLKRIHKDNRGVINTVIGNELEDEELVFLITKRGVARGGCIHNKNDEMFVIIQGKVEYFIKNKEVGRIYTKGMNGFIPKGTPHYLIALEDSIVMEWGATSEEKKNKHKEFRTRVEEINAKQI